MGRGCDGKLPQAFSTASCAGSTAHFQRGAWPDEVIFRHALEHELEPDELVHADRGYRNYDGDVPRFITPSTAPNNALYESNKKVRARHESINGRFKRFRVISGPFRHGLEKQGECFRAVATLVQLMLRHDDSVFQVKYKEM